MALTEQEFEALVKEHTGGLLRTLTAGFTYRKRTGELGRAFVPSAALQEEIAQDTWLEFHVQQQKGNYDRSRPLEPYLYTILRRCTLKRLFKELRDVPDEDWLTPKSDESTVDEALRVDLQRFLERLPEEDAKVLRLKRIEGRSEAEVGKMLGLSRDQVSRRLRSVTQRLRGFMGAIDE